MKALIDGNRQIEVKPVEGNLPEIIEIEGVQYCYDGIQDGLAYYSVHFGLAYFPVENSPLTDALSELERIGTREDGCGIPATVQSTYLGGSISVREENGVAILSREFSDGRKVEVRLDPEVLGNLIDWTIDKCSNSVILSKLDSMISNPPGLDGIHCELRACWK